ncbi:integrase/recombinase [Streptomyces laurentii]|uniref:Integrase/recombinase n=1 Tax=Streptomyces laurentii TaxID=39478 RepID=A0A160P9U0_STRLU|nr:integrase/recombinase [Streptomyces laurentii]
MRDDHEIDDRPFADPSLPLGGYCRISDADLADIRRAVKEGRITEEEAAELERKGVLKQKDDLRWLAGKHNREVVFYEDNNLSAFKRNVSRPDFKRALSDLRAVRIAGMLSYDIDRFARQPRDLEKAIDIYEDSRKRLIFDTMSGQNFDLSTADGRFSARLFVSIANKASSDTSRRIIRDNKWKAAKGKYHGGTLAYGWDVNDRDKLDPQAAKLINEIIDGHIAGDSIHTCMDYLHENGAVNPNTGQPFTWAGTKTMIFRARNFGIRIYKGQPQFNSDGSYVMGDWEPLVVTPNGEPDLAKFEALQAIQKGAIKPGDKTTAKYFLSRIIRCGRCMFPMTGKPVWIRGRKSNTFAYNCNKQHPDQCGGLQVSGPRVDQLIKDLIFGMVEKAATERSILEAAQPEPWEKEDEFNDILEQIEELKALWEAKQVRASSYVTALDDLESRRDDLKAERAMSIVPPAIKVLSPELLTKGWDGLSLERQRLIVREILTAVIIHPSGRGKGRTFDATRVEPVFR